MTSGINRLSSLWKNTGQKKPLHFAKYRTVPLKRRPLNDHRSVVTNTWGVWTGSPHLLHRCLNIFLTIATREIDSFYPCVWECFLRVTQVGLLSPFTPPPQSPGVSVWRADTHFTLHWSPHQLH